MKIFDKFTTSTPEALAKWISDFGNHDNGPWMNWFDKTYCQKCEPEIVTRDESKSKLGFQLLYKDKTECSYCEVHKECRFFPNRPTPDIEEMVKMWLDQEVEDNETKCNE